jgi:hypothetical protein
MALATRAAIGWERPSLAADSLFVLSKGSQSNVKSECPLRAGRHIKLALRFSSLKPKTKTLDATGQCYAAKRRAGRGRWTKRTKRANNQAGGMGNAGIWHMDGADDDFGLGLVRQVIRGLVP